MARLIDADELLEHVYRDRLDSRERIAEMIKNAPTVVKKWPSFIMKADGTTEPINDCEECLYKKQWCELIQTFLEKQMEKEPKKGHWIMHDKHRECSRCKVWLLKDMPRCSYCPNCGSYNGDLEWR